MIVRNSGVLRGFEQAGFIDKADFEKVKLRGQNAVENWIDDQLHGTSVTVVLIGNETLSREYVQYEIRKSIDKGNGIIGVKIHNLTDMITRHVSQPGNVQTVIGSWKSNNALIYFDDIADGIYDYVNENGYQNLGAWVETAARNKGR